MKDPNHQKTTRPNKRRTCSIKTAKEFFERLQNDEAFAKEVSGKAQQLVDAGQKDYKEVCISIAAEYGYEVTAKELEEAYEQAAAELSDEEPGKVSGGVTPLLIVASAVGLNLIAVGSIMKTKQ